MAGRKKTTAPPKKAYKGGRVEQTPAAERQPTRQPSRMGGLNKIGALWLNTTRQGKKYMSGRLELSEGDEIRIMVFKNDYKDAPRQADYIIYEPENLEEKQSRANAAKDWKGGKTTDANESGDDIPF